MTTKLIVDLILFATAMASVFYVAGLGNVPKRVRFSVLAIGPSFMLTFLLHLSWSEHLDYGLTAIGVSTIAAAIIGFHYNQTAPLTKEARNHLVKRFVIIISISVASAVAVVALIVKMNGGSLIVSPVSQPGPVQVAPSAQETSDEAKWNDLTK